MQRPLQGQVPPAPQRAGLWGPLPPTVPTRTFADAPDLELAAAPGWKWGCGFPSGLPAPRSLRPGPQPAAWNRRALPARAARIHLPQPRRAPRPGCALRLLAACGGGGRRKGGGSAPAPGSAPLRSPHPRAGRPPRARERTRRAGLAAKLGAARRGRGALRDRGGSGPARAAAAGLRPPPPRAPGGGADPGGSGREAPAAEGGARRGWAARRRSRSVAAPSRVSTARVGRAVRLRGKSRDAPRPPPRRARPRAPPRRAARGPAGDAEQPRGMRRPQPLAPLRVCAAPLARLPRGPPPWRPGGSRSSR